MKNKKYIIIITVILLAIISYFPIKNYYIKKIEIEKNKVTETFTTNVDNFMKSKNKMIKTKDGTDVTKNYIEIFTKLYEKKDFESLIKFLNENNLNFSTDKN